ncbi:hypothetical protein N7453_002623 [Penicillium expansum]|nr:hypothetical protein N7453_002623 [Penicillium expansum]
MSARFHEDYVKTPERPPDLKSCQETSLIARNICLFDLRHLFARSSASIYVVPTPVTKGPLLPKGVQGIVNSHKTRVAARLYGCKLEISGTQFYFREQQSITMKI